MTQKVFLWCLGIFAVALAVVIILGSLNAKKTSSTIILSGLSGNNRAALTVNIGKDVSPQQIVALSNAISGKKIACTFFVSQDMAEELSPVWRAQIMNGNEIAYYYDGSDFDSLDSFSITSSFKSWETFLQKNIDSSLKANYIRAGNTYDYKNLYIMTALAESSANLIGWSIELKDMSKSEEQNIKKILKNEIIDGAIIKMDISSYNIEKLIIFLSEEAMTKKLDFVVLGKMFES
jgi:hypothetical protein